ncbi:hypothetical protein J4410_06815 [Candidatus Woesearchaeota archaeon]|nr:hypothetical protein [Candidatus Woesearchaeota archaeon]
MADPDYRKIQVASGLEPVRYEPLEEALAAAQPTDSLRNLACQYLEGVSPVSHIALWPHVVDARGYSNGLSSLLREMGLQSRFSSQHRYYHLLDTSGLQAPDLTIAQVRQLVCSPQLLLAILFSHIPTLEPAFLAPNGIIGPMTRATREFDLRKIRERLGEERGS